MTEEEFNALCERELGRFSQTVQALLSRNIEKYSVSGQTRDSIRMAVVQQSGQYLAALDAAFSESGRFMEMRQLRHGALPPLAPILEWVKKRGAGAFAYVPGYQPGWKVPTQEAQEKRIAWAMRYHIRAKVQKKPQKWWSKDFYGGINSIINNVAAGYGLYAGGAVIANLKIQD